MTHSTITSRWLKPDEWLNGWNILQDTQAPAINQPSVWLIDTEESHGRFANWHTALSEEEIAKGDRFRQAVHKNRYKAAHTALRMLLAKATATTPSAIHFTKGHHHKPGLLPVKTADVQFNMSYTEKKAMIGMALNHPIGIDIEWLQRPLVIDDMLTACFSKNEIEFITSRSEGMHDRFFTLWTRKEAILKLTGEGIGEHLPYFEVLDGTGSAAHSVIGGNPPDHIHLYSFPLGDDYLGSFASPIPIDKLFFYAL